jgi:hypothetical protein
MVSLALFLAAFGPLSTRYGFPSGNSSTAPIDASATVTPVSCEDALFPPPHRAGLWTHAAARAWREGLCVSRTRPHTLCVPHPRLPFALSPCGEKCLSWCFRPGEKCPRRSFSSAFCRLLPFISRPLWQAWPSLISDEFPGHAVRVCASRARPLSRALRSNTPSLPSLLQVELTAKMVTNSTPPCTAIAHRSHRAYHAHHLRHPACFRSLDSSWVYYIARG